MERISFSHHGGFETLADCPSIGLIHWFARTGPEQQKDLGWPLPSFMDLPSADRLIEVSMFACERHFNKVPKLDTTKDFEDQCWDFLLWLQEHGDIVALERGEWAI